MSQQLSVGRSTALVATLLFCGCAATERDEAPLLSPEEMEVEPMVVAEAAVAPKAEPATKPAVESASGTTAARAAEAQEGATPAEQQAVSARWQAMWLVAGSPPPPGLPTALLNARNERSEGALVLVRALLAGEEADAFRAALTEIFVREETPDLLWCAVARASAALSLHDTAPHLVVNLESSSSARRVAASEALHTMRGEWFSSAAEAEAHLSVGPPPASAQRATLRAMTTRIREFAAELYVLDPTRAVAALDDPDPALRVLAARALSEVLTNPAPSEGFDSDQARAALLARVSVEEHPEALLTLIVTSIENLGSVEVCTLEARAFSTTLHARADRCDVTLLAPIAHGLARMPLDPTLPVRDEAGESDACSMAFAGEALEDLLMKWMGPGRLVDTDSLASALRSFETLLERPLFKSDSPALCAVLLEAVEDPLRAPSVRTGAARALARAGRPEDLPRLAAALDGAPTDVAYELVATISRLVEGAEVSSESAIAARDALVAMLYRDEASLRRRALSLLATEPLAALVETTDARMFLVVLEQDIPTEDSEMLLGLLARRENPALVDAILSSSAFPRLADPTSGMASSLTAALGRLAAGDGPRTHAVARHLMETAGYGDRVQRLRNALALHAALPDSAAESLMEEQHKDLVTWALELREAAGSLSGVTAEPVPITFIERLIDIHLVKCEVDSVRDRWAHPTALLLADLFDALLIDPADEARAPFVGRTMGHFERALRYAGSTAEVNDNVIVLRDRARFHLMAGDTFKALRDYRKAINLERGPDGDHGTTSVLGLADLRRAASLAADAVPAEPVLLPSALDLSLALIGRVAWSSEPPGVRLEDLRALVAHAGDSELERERVRPLFAGLPARDMDLADETLPTKAPWLGLEADAEQLKELRALAESLEVPAPVEPVPADPKPSEEAEVSEEGSKPVSEEDPPSRS